MMPIIMLDNREIIQVRHTVGHVHGLCPFCGAMMHVSTSSLGKRFAKLDNGQVHTNSECIKMHSLRKTPTIEYTNFDILFPKLLYPEPKGKKKYKKNSDGPQRLIHENSGENDLTAITSLSQLAEALSMIFSSDYVTENERRISEYFIRPSWLPEVKNGNETHRV